jgi:hypothetical protein
VGLNEINVTNIAFLITRFLASNLSDILMLMSFFVGSLIRGAIFRLLRLFRTVRTLRVLKQLRLVDELVTR